MKLFRMLDTQPARSGLLYPACSTLPRKAHGLRLGWIGKLTPKACSNPRDVRQECSIPKQSTYNPIEYRRVSQPGIMAKYCFKLSPRRLINGHCVFFRNRRDQSLITAKPSVAGSRSGRMSLSSMSIESYASCTMQRVQWRIRLSFSVRSRR